MQRSLKKYQFQKWKTPLVNAEQIDLWSVLYVANKVHFIFRGGSRKRRSWYRAYVMTIPRWYPYRFYEEKYAFRYLLPKFNFTRANKDGNYRGTWVLQGKNFFNTIENGKALSCEIQKITKNRVKQYLIVTTDDWVEFTSCPPIWTVHNKFSISDLLVHYNSKRGESFWYEVCLDKVRKKRNLKAKMKRKNK